MLYYIDKLEIAHRHARGPGGQHVNKSEKFLIFYSRIIVFSLALSGVEIRFHLDSAAWIPDWIKPRFRDMVWIINYYV